MKKIISLALFCAVTAFVSCKDDDPVPPESTISLDRTELALLSGSMETLTATVANVADKSVRWSSDKTDVATVSQTGEVTAVAQGTAVITATITADGKTAVCTVTVDPLIKQEHWKVVDYRDTEIGDGDGPDALIDDDINTYWHAKWSIGSILPSWITVELTDPSLTVMIKEVELYARQNNATGPKKVEILTSMDGVDFTLFGTLDFQNIITVQKVTSAEPVKARYVKMNITEKNNDSVAMGEMYVRGIVE